MTKPELVSRIAEKAGMTKKDAEIFLDAYVSAVTEALVEGEKIQLMGFMTMETVEKAESVGRNPKTGEEITIPKHRKCKVKIGSKLKEAVK